MRILWLSNILLSDCDNGNSGTWLYAMAQGLARSGEVYLANITQGSVDAINRQDCGSICQWVIPLKSRLNSNGLPADGIITDIVRIVQEFSPDLVHIWGTEYYWGLLTARKIIKGLVLLETQGLKFAIAKVFNGGLSVKEQLACVGPKEILKRSTIYQERKNFEKWGFFEKEIISQHRYIAVQTEWVESQVKAINRTCKTFQSDLALREPFYSAQSWQFSGDMVIFCSAAYSCPFKGLHVAIRSIAILKNIFPNIRLRIAGAHQREGIRQDGYIVWLNSEIKKNGIEANVEWLGSIKAAEIVEEMKAAGAIIIPTFIENCCTTMQEAMLIGTPVVASYTGGLPSLARDEESVLFFPPGDETMCAHKLERVLTDRELAMRLSKVARQVAEKRNDPERVVFRQLDIYKQIIAECIDEHV